MKKKNNNSNITQDVKVLKNSNKKDNKFLHYVFLLFIFMLLYTGFDFKIFSPPVESILISFGLLFIPGYFILKLTRLDFSLDIFSIIPISCVFSLGLFLPFALLSYSVNLKLVHLFILYTGTSLILGIFSLKSISKMNYNNSVEIQEKSNTKWFILIILLSIYLGWHFGCWISGDFIHHMTNIRKLYELPRIIFQNYTLKDLPWPIYGHNIWHLFISLIAYISHIDPIVIWIYSAVFLIPLKILSFKLASRQVFNSDKIAFLTTVVYFFSESLMNYDRMGFKSPYWYMTASAYPSSIARDIILMVIIYFIFLYIKKQNNKYLFILSILGAVLSFTHFYYMLILSYILIIFLFGTFLLSRNYFNFLLKAFISVVIIGLPYAVWYSHNLTAKIVNPIFNLTNMPWDHNPTIMISGKYPFFHPLKSLFGNPVTALATILVPLLLIKIKQRVYSIFLFSISVSSILIFFNPPVLYLLQKINPALDRIYRTIEVFPTYWIIGFFWSELLISSKFYLKFTGKWIISILIIFMSIYQIDYLKRFNNFTSESMYENFNQLVEFKKVIHEKIPPGSVVLLPTQYIWTWLTMLPYYPVIAAWEAHLPPYYDQSERVKLQKKFLEDPLDKDSFIFLNKYKVDYIFLDMDKQLIPYQDKFQLILKTRQWSIYKYIK